MVLSKEQFLRNLAANPQLVDNIVAIVFAQYPDIDISSREKVFDLIKPYYKQYKLKRPEIDVALDPEAVDISSWIGKDLRIKKVRLSSVRAFPRSDVPFGMDLVNTDGEPQSLIILGGNATGKSSLFNSLEYLYCDRIGEADLRSSEKGNSDRYSYFLEHFNAGIENSKCHIEAVDMSFDIKNCPNIPDEVRSSINPETHFISDYDIYENGKLDYEKGIDTSFHQQIARKLGFQNMLEFNKQLKSFIGYRRVKETSDIRKAERTIEAQENSLMNARKAIIAKKKILEQIQSEESTQEENGRIQNLLSLLSSLKLTRWNFSELSSPLIEAWEEYHQAHEDYIDSQVKTMGTNEIQFLSLGLEMLKENGDCPFCQNSQFGISSINEHVRQRIERLKSRNEATQRLQKSMNTILDLLNRLYSQLYTFSLQIQKELEQLSPWPEFNSLAEKESSFLSQIDELLTKEVLLEIQNLNINPNYHKDRSKYLADLLQVHTPFIQSYPEKENQIEEMILQREDLLRNLDENIKSKSEIKSNVERIALLRKEIEDFEIQEKTSNQIIASERKNKETYEATRSLFLEIQASFQSYEKIYGTALNRRVAEAFDPIKDAVEVVLREYFKNDERDLELVVSKDPEEVDEETGEVLSEIFTARIKRLNTEDELYPVGKIMNTFHYRLFSTMVAVAIAIASRINTNINIPLILDDIFYASDFENRATINTFIHGLYRVFKRYTKDMPLQMILFTHDQLVFESAISAMYKVESLDEDDFDFAKLIQQEDSIEENGYKNLIYRFPAYFPHKAIEKLFPTT